MDSLETELERARALDESELADAIETIGFECTRCGACCKAESACGEDGASTDEAGGTTDGASENDEADTEPHTATVFPDEIRQLQAAGEYDFRDVARPMPYGLADGPDGPEGETFEWALQTDDCGDCTFYAEDDDGMGACTVHGDRPLICRTYPFSVALGGTSQPMGETVDEEGMVQAHECEGLGRDISRTDAEDLAAALKERAVRELEEAIGVRDNYRPVDASPGQVVVHDSEGAKRPDGSPYE
ncbi:zinc/iron-chelating domain-containing protein [Haloarcula mannanilytica]|uniref:Zinc/iron-chelating domain-containing protein n=1 Tax=Haloarcula mannanilytica TaxID=2509225 RepID=A0A4C2EMV9_9EURY|nr:YkgJ family cysteine cluster protein [Haloarcula mannanilytica]GCF14977.1 zinc/iron-chelating domain-containing protein [Haloarcula mannanilytica]